MSESLQLRVDGPLYGGDCLAHSDDGAAQTRLPFVIPGEEVLADVAQPQTRLLEVLSPSPARVAPHCRHFGACGGCQMQHMSAPAQIDAKITIVTNLLRDAGMRDTPEVTAHAAEPWHYRNRIRLRVQSDQVGYSRRASNEFLPIEECPIASTLLLQAAFTARDLVRSGRAIWPQQTAEMELFTNADEASLQISFQLNADVTTVERDAPASMRKLCDELKVQVPQLAGAGMWVAAAGDASMSKRVRESHRMEIARWGDASTVYRVDGREYRITRGGFFQVNRYLTGTMAELVGRGRSGTLAWDLFAGAGLFSLPLTQQFDRIVAVEIGEPAASDLQAHLRSAGAQHKAERSTTLDFLKRNAAGKPDLIVMDPPRAGLGSQVTRLLGQIGASELVYVSCDPTTFARDARALIESRYALTELNLLDLFPQTFHMETIAVFRR